jgi:hypothetical protein
MSDEFEKYGELCFPTKLSGSSMNDLLVDEFYHAQDLDGNGLIYGYDFYVKEGAPIFIKVLESSEFWSIPSKYISTWSDFIENNIDNLLDI